MKLQPLFIATLGAVVMVLWWPRATQAQADDSGAVLGLINEIAAQQVTLSENQAKIDEQLAAVAEEVRVARIFAGRGR